MIMTAKQLGNDIERFCGSAWINKTELCRYLGYKDADKMNKFLVGLPRIGTRYAVADVAEVLHNCKEYK